MTVLSIRNILEKILSHPLFSNLRNKRDLEALLHQTANVSGFPLFWSTSVDYVCKKLEVEFPCEVYQEK